MTKIGVVILLNVAVRQTFYMINNLYLNGKLEYGSTCYHLENSQIPLIVSRFVVLFTKERDDISLTINIHVNIITAGTVRSYIYIINTTCNMRTRSYQHVGI